MQPKLKMNCQKERGKSLERRKITMGGFKGLTHSISYNVRTTTCTVLASAAQTNTTPMQNPNSVTGQACLSSTVLTAHNILLPAGVISRISLQSLCHRYSDRNVSLFYPKIVVISCIGTAVLLYWYKVYIRKIVRMNAERLLRRELIISSHFLTSCLVLGSKPNQSFQPGNSNTDSHHVVLQALFCKTAKPREPTNTTGQQQHSSTGAAA